MQFQMSNLTICFLDKPMFVHHVQYHSISIIDLEHLRSAMFVFSIHEGSWHYCGTKFYTLGDKCRKMKDGFFSSMKVALLLRQFHE